VDGASVLRFIEAPHAQAVVSGQIGALSEFEWDLLSEQISELTSCSLIGSGRSEACSVLLSEQKRRGAEHENGNRKPGNPVRRDCQAPS
jgi:hypothetical protein